MLTTTRRLSRTDTILLAIVASLAIGSIVGSLREDRAYAAWRKSPGTGKFRSHWPIVLNKPTRARGILQGAKAGLITASLGLAVVAFRPGRNARPRRRGPGYAALALSGGLILATIGWSGISYWIEWFLAGPALIYDDDEPWLAWTMIGQRVTPTVAWGLAPAWIDLAIAGRWRRPVDPLEKLGRWLGWCWIGITVADWVVDKIVRN